MFSIFSEINIWVHIVSYLVALSEELSSPRFGLDIKEKKGLWLERARAQNFEFSKGTGTTV